MSAQLAANANIGIHSNSIVVINLIFIILGLIINVIWEIIFYVVYQLVIIDMRSVWERR